MNIDELWNKYANDLINPYKDEELMDKEQFTQAIAEVISRPLEVGVGKHLLTELRKHYLVEIDFETGEPKADMKTLMDLWEKVNNHLEIKTIGKT